MNSQKVSLFWFRRDLRLEDNHGLFQALNGEHPVQPIFIFDENILKNLPLSDARVTFIHQELSHINQSLKANDSSLDVRVGNPLEVWKQLVSDYDISEVHTNNDYEPYARNRDKHVADFLSASGIPFKSYKDQVIFEKSEVVKPDTTPYTVFTPYSRVWKRQLTESTLFDFPSQQLGNWNKTDLELPTLENLGFDRSSIEFPSRIVNEELITNYVQNRDTPSIKGTSRMSVHLRFGTISIRKLVREVRHLSEKYLDELIWREFYQSILWHFPDVVHRNFNKKYDGVEWRNDEHEFSLWSQGKTGYPIVDAGMRELNTTGFMHNRVRMIVASFLCKHLLIDWRWGEAYFAEKLLDFDLASNNGGWQWAAGTGVDAAPYFRIFNPYTQTEKFDPQLKYIKKWVPELDSSSYPEPMVDHKFARERCLNGYKEAI